MSKFYIENKEDLRVLIVNITRNKNISEAVIEKDYWVTFILDYLFNGNNMESTEKSVLSFFLQFSRHCLANLRVWIPRNFIC